MDWGIILFILGLRHYPRIICCLGVMRGASGNNFLAKISWYLQNLFYFLKFYSSWPTLYKTASNKHTSSPILPFRGYCFSIPKIMSVIMETIQFFSIELLSWNKIHLPTSCYNTTSILVNCTRLGGSYLVWLILNITRQLQCHF